MNYLPFLLAALAIAASAVFSILAIENNCLNLARLILGAQLMAAACFSGLFLILYLYANTPALWLIEQALKNL